MKQHAKLRQEIVPALILLAAVAVCEYFFFQLWRLDWNVPMLYGGDGIFAVGQVQRSFGALTTRLGCPFYAPPPLEPNYDLMYDIFIAFVGLFTKNVGVGFNLYLLVVPFVNALSAYAVFRVLKLRPSLSVALGLTFGLCPYVQQRLAGHIMLAAAEFVPLSILLCVWCAEDLDFNRPRKGFWRDKRSWAALVMAFCIANNSGGYYAYFTCFMLCVVALCLLLRDKKISRIVPCVVTVVEIVIFTAGLALPLVWGALTGAGGTITNGSYRSPTGADIYGLRISSLLLSPNGFGWDKLATWFGRYFHFLAVDEGPMYNENGMGYLGIVGILGFLGLLVFLFKTHNWQGGLRKSPALSDRLWVLSRLTVAGLLLATIAGFGPIIGILLTFLRGYNRISVFLVFIALLAVGLCAEALLQHTKAKGKRPFYAFSALLVLLLGYGFWEQQGLFNPKYEQVQETWYQDEAFMAEVETAAGQNAVLFQLPYMKAFENGSQENMWDYTLLRGPLHSETLRFSYGGAYDGVNDTWYRETAALSPQECVAELRAQQVTGIYLDLDGYPIAEQDATLAAYTAAAGCGEAAVIRSATGLLCYIPLA